LVGGKTSGLLLCLKQEKGFWFPIIKTGVANTTKNSYKQLEHKQVITVGKSL
jgi:hypothetical protein